jgi:DNA repair protein RadC
MIAAGNVIGVDVLDHVIIGDGRYVSFKEQGRL